MKKNMPWLLCCLITGTVFLSAAHYGSRAISVISENTPIPRKNCIIIDAGHGGEDGGAVSCTGLPESRYNLEIACRLNDLFHLIGHDTRMTRTEDISIYTKGESLSEKKISDLKERAKIVNSTENGILISIHQNNFSDSRYKGPQVFFSMNEQSRRLAKQMQSDLTACLCPGSKRMSKKSSGIYLMDHIKTTGILIECGFLSNPEEEANLRSASYQKKLCCAIVSSVSEFLSNT